MIRAPEEEFAMRTYVVATGIVFAVLTLAHLWRIIQEPHLASDPWFMVATVVAATLSVAAWRVARRPGES
jgi:hypothetical protein